MKELKVGDKLIYTHETYLGKSVYVRTISKVNSKTYKLNNGALVYKDLKPYRENTRSIWSIATEKYEIFTKERIDELKKENEAVKYKNWISRINEYKLGNIEFMKRYIEEESIIL